LANTIVICAICSRRMLDHFTAEGGWQGCYPLDTARAIMLPEPRLAPTVTLPTVLNAQRASSGWSASLPPQDDDRSRFRYKLASDRKRKKGEEAALKGKVRQVYVMIGESEEPLTKREIANQGGLKESTVEHALYRLKQAELIDSVPA
jgi:hypothetical protein